jgi:hypothetical protein
MSEIVLQRYDENVLEKTNNSIVRFPLRLAENSTLHKMSFLFGIQSVEMWRWHAMRWHRQPLHTIGRISRTRIFLA